MEALQNLLGRFTGAAAGIDMSGVLQKPNGLFAILAFVVLVLYGLSAGKTKALVSLLSVYAAYALTVLFPFMDRVSSQIPLPENAPILGLLVFLVFYLVTFLLLSHSMIRHRLTLGEISMAKVVLISVVQLGLLSSISISLLPDEFAARSFGFAYPYLAGKLALWLWAVASLIILPFMRASSRE
jgi:hypothetical protein